MGLLHELTQPQVEEIEAIPLMEALEEAVRQVRSTRGGGMTKAIGGAREFFNKNPALTIGAAALAVSAFSQYKKNKRNTIRLHGKTAYEKKMMTDVVDALQSQGKFKVHRIKFEGGGKTWILRRKWMS